MNKQQKVKLYESIMRDLSVQVRQRLYGKDYNSLLESLINSSEINKDLKFVKTDRCEIERMLDTDEYNYGYFFKDSNIRIDTYNTYLGEYASYFKIQYKDSNLGFFSMVDGDTLTYEINGEYSAFLRIIYGAMIYNALVHEYPELDIIVESPDVFFITSKELYDLYPDLTAKEREQKIVKDKKTVFIMQIGDTLPDGLPHDGRAPDYDDWALNGDLLFWYDILDTAVEISSMGIRVDAESLLYQLEKSGNMDRVSLPFHQALLNGELPLTMGGGIGQSRLCMLLLNKAHVGEVQASVWPKEMIETCRRNNIELL